MKITIIRHFPTLGNINKRYIGYTDEPILKKIPKVMKYPDNIPFIFVSPLKRTMETAEFLFPKAEKIVIDDLREMNFGIFENKNYLELKSSKEYQNWIDSNCEDRCPMGESKAEFVERTVSAVMKIKETAALKGIEHPVIVAHGGTAMAVGEALATPKRGYFETHLNFGESITFEI